MPTTSTYTHRLARAMIALARITTTALLLLISTSLVSCKEERAEQIELSLHPLEMLATLHGPKIVVVINGKPAGELSAKFPKLVVSRVGESELTLSYVGPHGEATNVTWSQTVTSKDKKVVVVQPWRRPQHLLHNDDWYVLAWARPDDRTNVLEHLPKAVTVVSPIWWTLDEHGSIRSYADPELVRVLRNKNIAVWPAIHGLNANGLHSLLADDSRRSQVAAQIASQAKMDGAQGVNIDIEGFRIEDSDAEAAFVEDLAGLVHAWGGTVSYDMVARSDAWESLPVEMSYWSNAPQRRRLAAAVDYTILMAYDQFNRYRPGGPVAAPNWVRDVLIYLLRYTDPQNVMLGIPAYGRIWNPQSLNTPQAVSLSQLDGRDGRRSFDEAHCIDRIVRPDGYFYWAEDDVADSRIELSFDYQLAGISVWRLGLDYPKLWDSVRTLEQAHFSFFDRCMKFLFDWPTTVGRASCPNVAQ